MKTMTERARRQVPRSNDNPEENVQYAELINNIVDILLMPIRTPKDTYNLKLLNKRERKVLYHLMMDPDMPHAEIAESEQMNKSNVPAAIKTLSARLILNGIERPTSPIYSLEQREIWRQNRIRRHLEENRQRKKEIAVGNPGYQPWCWDDCEDCKILMQLWREAMAKKYPTRFTT